MFVDSGFELIGMFIRLLDRNLRAKIMSNDHFKGSNKRPEKKARIISPHTKRSSLKFQLSFVYFIRVCIITLPTKMSFTFDQKNSKSKIFLKNLRIISYIISTTVRSPLTLFKNVQILFLVTILGDIYSSITC